MPAPTLLSEREGAVVTLTFNRPDALNALNLEMAQAFLGTIRAIAADTSVRALVLNGAGRAFIAGGDLALLRANPSEGTRALLTPLNEAIRLMHQMDAPIIAQVHGASAGGGMSLMLMCDFILAAEGTKFNLAYINLGTNCDLGGSWALPRLVGLRHALEIALLGENLSADEALRLGLINRVLPAAELQAATHTLAERLAAGPTRAYGRMKRLMLESLDRDLAGQLEAEALSFEACTRTDDLREGLEAFFERRKPVFRGH